MGSIPKAVQATGMDDGPTVVARMKATPMDDFASKDIVMRADGHVLHTLFRPLAEGGCVMP